MSAPAFPRAALLYAIEGRCDDEPAGPVPAHGLLSAVAAYDEAVRQLAVDQRVAGIAALAHQWARARRALDAARTGEERRRIAPKYSSLSRRLQEACGVKP